MINFLTISGNFQSSCFSFTSLARLRCKEMARNKEKKQGLPTSAIERERSKFSDLLCRQTQQISPLQKLSTSMDHLQISLSLHLSPSLLPPTLPPQSSLEPLNHSSQPRPLQLHKHKMAAQTPAGDPKHHVHT